MEESLINWLKKLVQIPSGSFNRAGVKDVQMEVQRIFKQIGLETRTHPSLDSQYSDQFILEGYWKPKAKKQHPFQGPWITLVTHADTVFEEESGFVNFKWDGESEKAFGPGVIDDKGGIVVATEGVRRFLQSEASIAADFGIRILVTPSEEIGSPGFQKILADFGKETRLALGFEPALVGGGIIGSRRGNRWYEVNVEGKAAHTGRAAHQGVNAAHEIAHHLVDLQKWAEKNSEVVVQVGKLEGGQKVNIVCSNAHALIDTRFSDFVGQKKIEKKFTSLLKTKWIKGKNGLPKTTLRIIDDCPPFTSTKESKRIQATYLRSLKQIEKKSYSAGMGGGAADVNFMSHPQLMVLDGLGPVGGGLHETSEYIYVKSLETRSTALVRFLEELAKSGLN